MGHVGLDRFRNLLFRLLLDHAGLDFRQFKRQGAQNTLWAEIERLQKIRNRIIHRAEDTTSIEAELSISVAQAVLDEIFPAVVAGLGLHVHEGVRVCNDYLCKLGNVLSPELITRLRNRTDHASYETAGQGGLE